jgi:putative redox protein
MTKFKIDYLGDLRTRCVHEQSGQELLTDAPLDNQGKGEFFSPTDLVGLALGSCVLTLMGIAAKRLGVSIEGSTLTVEKEMKGTPSRMIGKLILQITCPVVLESKAIEQIERAARNCPVHHSLHPDIIQEFHFTWKS